MIRTRKSFWKYWAHQKFPGFYRSRKEAGRKSHRLPWRKEDCIWWFQTISHRKPFWDSERLSFFVPKIFTAIAFDSGGVASGPMTATFLLPFAQGACIAVGGNIVADAFGVVAMVAMAPLITIQILGMVYQFKTQRAPKPAQQPELRLEQAFALLDDDAIIEL